MAHDEHACPLFRKTQEAPRKAQRKAPTETAIELYCQCGYPILVAAHWTGHDYSLSLHDAQYGKDSQEIQRCPQCGEKLQPGDLERLPPIGLHRAPLDAKAADG